MRANGSLIMTKAVLSVFVVGLFLNTAEVPGMAQSQVSWLEKAQVLERDGFWGEAAEAWNKLATIDPNPKLVTYARLRLGTIYLKLGQLQQSIDAAQEVVKSHPDNFDAHFHLANSLSSFQRFSEAIKAYEKTVILKPEEGLGYVGLGLAFFGNSDSKKAIEALLKAKKLFKDKRNISWYRDTRVMVGQIKHFEKFPPSFSNLWLKNNFKVVHDTYEGTVFNAKQYLR